LLALNLFLRSLYKTLYWCRLFYIHKSTKLKMDKSIIFAVGGVVLGLIIGFVISKILEKNNASKLVKEAKKNATLILKEAKIEGETLKKDKMLQAKEKFLELKSEHEKVILSRDKKMAEAEKRTRDKESQISSEVSRTKKINESLESKIKNYDHKLDVLENKQDAMIKSMQMAENYCSISVMIKGIATMELEYIFN
jgi:ribonuclease Y